MISKEDVKHYEEILKDAINFRGISPWEQEFCNDMLGRLERVGELANFSEKQISIIERIEKKVYGT